MAIPGQINNTVYFEENDAKRSRMADHLRNQASGYGVLNGARIINVPDTLTKAEVREIAAASHDWRASGVVILAASPKVKIKGMFRSTTQDLEKVVGINDLNEIIPADLYKADSKHPHIAMDDSTKLAIVAADMLGTAAAKGGTMSVRDTNYRADESTMGIPQDELEEMRRRQAEGNGTSTDRTTASRFTGPPQR
jgi:hypothetical protein